MPRLMAAWLVALPILAVAACARPMVGPDDVLVGAAVAPEMPMYCYRNLGKATCYDRPITRDASRLYYWAGSPPGNEPEPPVDMPPGRAVQPLPPNATVAAPTVAEPPRPMPLLPVESQHLR